MTIVAASRTLTTDALTPGPGLERTRNGWLASRSPVTLSAEAPLDPGWYTFRIRIRSKDHFALHKRVEVRFDAAGPSTAPIATDALHWNRTLDVRFSLHLPKATSTLTLTLVHAEGEFTLDKFAVRRIPEAMVGLSAVGEKLRLISAYRCLAPVLWRGSGLLLSGKFTEFRKKVLNGLADSRTMRLGAFKGSEIDGGWWRRHTLPADEAAVVRAAVDVMPNPPPLAVLLPVDLRDINEARAAAHSVRRQLYPHWELLVACAGPPHVHPALATMIGPDPRVKVFLVREDDGLETAVAQALADTDRERLLVLPASVELAEDALYRFVEELRANPTIEAVGAPVYDALAAGVQGENAKGKTVWVTRTHRVPADFPSKPTTEALAAWASDGVPTDARRSTDRVLGYPAQSTPFIDRTRVGPTPPKPEAKLTLAADLIGITGWDHVTYSVLRGLPAAGVQLVRHPRATLNEELIPPAYLPPHPEGKQTAPVLAVRPPFALSKFGVTRRTAVYTMWETDGLPPDDVKQLNAAGLVVVPSEWQVGTFHASGVTTPMAVAPLGFDPLVFHDDGTPPPDVCTFGTAGALVAGGMRKNAQRVIDLFREAFPTEKGVRLRVKISPTSPAVETYDDSRIDLIRGLLPHHQLAAWYRSITAYVNGSFGEGFGLHLIEAMACGRPLITPDYSGLTAFFEPSLGYAVGHSLVSVNNDIYRGRWAEPDEDEIVARMREVFADQTEAARKGQLSASRAAGFTWRKSGRKLADALRQHGFLS